MLDNFCRLFGLLKYIVELIIYWVHISRQRQLRNLGDQDKRNVKDLINSLCKDISVNYFIISEV